MRVPVRPHQQRTLLQGGEPFGGRQGRLVRCRFQNIGARIAGVSACTNLRIAVHWMNRD